MDDPTMPDIRRFLVKLLPIEPLAEALDMLETYATAQFDLTHGTSIIRLEAEIRQLDNQIRFSNEELEALKKQKHLIPKTIKKSNLINGGDNK